MTKSLLLELTAAFYGIAASIQNKVCFLGTTFLVISNEEMKDILRTVKSLEIWVILLKAVTRVNENETKEPRGRSCNFYFTFLLY